MRTFKLANWSAPKNITALSTTRLMGFSQAPYDYNNLGLHVGDNPKDVAKNRQQLVDLLHLPNEPVWLDQTHSVTCITVEENGSRHADAAITRSSQYPLVILTADCLPITLCNQQGSEIAAIHAGWKGLNGGIIENTIAKMMSTPDDLIAWIGPSICQNCYEVGEELLVAFTENNPKFQAAFKPHNNKWLANLPQIAAMILQENGIKSVFQSELCTFELKNDFYSYRKNAKTGRIGTLIWFNEQPQDKII